jgi:hypothetical protein
MLCAFCKGVLLPRTSIIVILSDVRRSVATERESKDLCIASHQGILTVHSVPKRFAPVPQGSRPLFGR